MSDNSENTTKPKELLPEKIANIVFDFEPSSERKFQLFCDDDMNDNYGIVTIFEIFLTLFIEGMFKKVSDPSKINEETSMALNPWLSMMGFNVIVKKYDISEREKLKKYYSWVALKCDPSWSQYFKLSNIQKNYHFISGNLSPYKTAEHCSLENLFAKFSYDNECVYKIKFKFV